VQSGAMALSRCENAQPWKASSLPKKAVKGPRLEFGYLTRSHAAAGPLADINSAALTASRTSRSDSCARAISIRDWSRCVSCCSSSSGSTAVLGILAAIVLRDSAIGRNAAETGLLRNAWAHASNCFFNCFEASSFPTA
jgi:hypothetical protein